MTIWVFHVDPVPKPRLTQRDRWKKRPVFIRWIDYKDALKDEARRVHFPADSRPIHLRVFVPMPRSWSKKRRAAQLLKPHNSRPDWDNYGKAFCDALWQEDKEIWDVRTTKYWAEEGLITVEEVEPDRIPNELLSYLGVTCGNNNQEDQLL